MHHVTVVAAHTSQFWPTVGRALTLLATIGAGTATRYGIKNHTINNRIEVLVNGQLHGKLDELAATTEQLKQVSTELAEAKAQLTSTEGAGNHTVPPQVS